MSRLFRVQFLALALFFILLFLKPVKGNDSICMWEEFTWLTRQISKMDINSWVIDFARGGINEIKQPSTGQRKLLEGEFSCNLPSKNQILENNGNFAEVSFVNVGLERIPFGLCSFTRVKHLRLIMNKIESFLPAYDSAQIDCMKKLQIKALDLQQNQMKTFDFSIVFDISSLEELILDSNLLDTLSPLTKRYSVISNLTSLSIKNNR